MSTENENFCSLASPRLKEERLRIGLSQADAASKCGVSREIWGRYEKGSAAPGGEVLFSFGHTGADILYILTGRREPKVGARSPFDDVSYLALQAVQEWQVEAGKTLPVDKFLRAVELLIELANGDPQQVKKHAASVLRLAA